MKKFLTLMLTALFSAVMFAATETTVYYTAPAATIGSYTVKLNTNQQTNPDSWHQYDMTLTSLEYNGDPIYSATYTDLWDGVDKMQIQLYDGDTWKSQEQPISSWTAVAAYNGKMWIHGGSTWVELSGEEPDPTIAIKGAWDGWTLTQLVLAGNKETASLTKEMSVGNYEFGLELNSAWTANGSNFSRANNSYAVTGSGSNMHLDIDAAGEYTFTWTFATNTLEVTYPAEAEPIYTVVGVPALMGSEWSFAEAAGNDMEKQLDGTYKLVKTDVTLAVGSYEYKMVKNRSWSEGYPSEGNASLSISEAGKYDITFILDLTASPEYSATSELKEATVVIPTIAVKGAWDSWTTHTLEKAVNDLTASVTLNIATTGEYEFGVDKNSSFIANKATISRASNSSVVADENTGNMKLNADVEGDYTFTWTYATNTLEVTYPAEPVPTYTVAGSESAFGSDWNLNDAANEMVLDGGVYKLTKTGLELIADNIEFKVVKNHAYENGSWPASNYVLTIPSDGIYRIDITFDPTDVGNEITAVATKTGEAEIVPTVKVKGSWDWSAETTLTGDATSVSTTINLTAGTHYFKMLVGGNYRSNDYLYHRNFIGAEGITMNETNDMRLEADIAGDYTFTWTFATNKIEITFPELTWTEVRSGLAAERYYTVCWPKKMLYVRGASVWSFAGKDASMAYLVKEEGALEAGIPYIIYAAEAGAFEAVLVGDDADAGSNNNGLYGTLSYMDADDLAAAGATHMLKSNELRPIGSNNHLDANRAYVILDNITGGKPAGMPAHKVRGIPMQRDAATSIDELNASEKPVKMMIDGQLFIIRGEKMYDATGRLVK